MVYKTPSLSMKFSQMKLPGLPDPPELEVPGSGPAQKGFLPESLSESEKKLQQAATRHPIPEVARRSDFTAKYNEIHHVPRPHENVPVKALLKAYQGHLASVNAVDFSIINGREFLFSASNDGSARMWNAANGQCIQIFEGHTGAVRAVCAAHINGDGKHDVKSRVIKQTLNPEWGNPKTDKWAFKLDNTYKNIQFKIFDWDSDTKFEYIGQVKLDVREALGLTQSSTDVTKITKWFPIKKGDGGQRGSLRVQLIWDEKHGEFTVFLIAAKNLPRMDGFLGQADPVVDISITDQKKAVVFTAGDDKVIKMWSIMSGQVSHSFVGHTRPVTSISVSVAFGTYVLVSGSLDCTVRIWDTKDASCLRSIKHPAAVNCLSLEVIPEKQKKEVNEDDVFLPAEICITFDLELDVIRDHKQLNVYVIKAKNIPVMDSALAGGRADPFVTVTLGDVTKTGHTQHLTLNPIWNDTFEFFEFDFHMEVVVRVFDWDALSSPSYIGCCSMSLEGMRLNRSIKMKWFTLDFNPYQRVRLFTGCADQKLRMMDAKSGIVLATWAGHRGPVTEIQILELLGTVQLLSSSMDKTVKLWDIPMSDEIVKRQQPFIKSFEFPSAINCFRPVVLYEKLRIIVGCEDAVIYMRTTQSAFAVLKEGWKRKLAKILESIPFAVGVMIAILVDISVGLYYDATLNPDPAINDCFSREFPPATIVTTLVLWVLWVFAQELFSQIILQGKNFFVPVGWSKCWNYADAIIIAISVGVASYKVVFDYSMDLFNDEGLYITPILVESSKMGQQYCLKVDESGSSKEAQKSATGFRTSRVLARIVTALRIIRAIAKAAALAKRLSEKKGKKWVGHAKSVTSLRVMLPAERGTGRIWAKLRSFGENFGCLKRHDESALEAWRNTFESKTRILTGSQDQLILTWDILGTDRRTDPRIPQKDNEVDKLPIAELAV